ncbi:choice-of-anchor D domain-containing protein [Rubrivirga sp.]|uniref:choice-of-anchor D domain-containing protein n=1 Tax=Rubrivirga sp. TaxID=1885344 RepID=UPI003B51E31A
MTFGTHPPTRWPLASLLGLLLVLLAAPQAQAQVPTLTDTFEAPEPSIELLDFGDTIEPLGDVNGDGVPDLAVGGYAARQDGMIDVGRAYVIDGATGAVIHTLAAPNAVQQGRFGDYIASLGDLDGDGVTDFVVTEQGATFDGADTGAAYAYSGATGTILYMIESPTPEDGGDFGSSAANAGDVDGDGLDDVLIGALNERAAPNGGGAGQVHVLSGADGSLIRTLTPTFTPGGGLFSFFGREVHLVGDLDGDGLRDHAVFTRFEGQGRVDFYSAADGAFIDALAPEFSTGSGEFGQAILTVPDLTGDGVDDLVIAAPQAEIISPFPPRVGRGVIQLYDGATRDLLREFRPPPVAGAEPEATGQSLALGADLDNDGVRDFYAGSPGADEPIGFPGINAGRVYIFSTATGTLLGQLSSPTPTRIGLFGDELATADLDGDGTDDLVVGAPRENLSDGRVYVYEQTFSTPIVQDGSFEAGSPNPFWTSFGIPSDPICSVETCGPNVGIEAYEGDWFAFFGRSNDATMGFVQQEVTIPDSVNTLSFYVKVPIADTGGNLSARIDGDILWSITQQDADDFETYQRVDVDISAYADGGTHTLRFQSATASSNPPALTFFFVDAVSINNRTSNAGIAISPGQVSFGTVPVGTVAQRTVTVTNTGTDPLIVSEVTIEPFQGPPGPITTDAETPFTVDAGASTTFDVFFEPTAAVTSVVRIILVSNAASSPTAILAGGTGSVSPEFSVDPESLAFDVESGETSDPQILTLTNSGTSAGTFSVFTTVTPPDALVPSDPTPADALRTPIRTAAVPAPSLYQSGNLVGVVEDGSFEATDPETRDNPFWNEASAQQVSPFCNAACFGDLARTGDWYAIFGFDVVLGTDFIEQEVDLAAGAYDLTLFYAGGTDRDGDGEEEAEAFFRIFVDDALIYELSAEEAQDFTLDYRQFDVTFDVEESGMKTLRFEFEQIVATPGEDIMQILMDDVSLAPASLRLTVEPRVGTVAPNDSEEIEVTADATDAEPGVYAVELLIQTDDPDAPTLVVPVTVTVGDAADGISIVVAGPGGFRFFGPPADGITVDSLAAQNLVRGVPGYYPAAEPANLWTEYDATTDTWIESDGTGEVLELGKAFRWRMYDKAAGNPDVSVSVPLPFTLSTALDANMEPVTVELQTDGTRFNYLANPFGEDLDLSGIEDWPGAENLSPSPVWTYAPAARMWTAAPASIPAWTAFRVRSKGPRLIDRPRTLTIPASAEDLARRTERTPAPGFSLTLSGTDADGVAIGDRAMTFAFRDDARAAFDESEDVEKFQTPAASYALVGARVGRAFVGHDVRPFADAEIPLAVEARGTEAAFTLRWDGSALPAGLPVVLVDLATGAEVDVRTRSSYAFEVAAREAYAEAPDGEVADGSQATDRFVLRIGTGLASAEAGVAEVALEAVAPNPSSGSARVSFAVPEAGAVRVAVYDVRGREVAVLVDGTMAAGRHEAVLSSGSLAAGVYVVRLEAGGQVLTRQAVVVR